MSSENKNDWVMHAAWAIQNLIKYDEMDLANLLNYAMNHILDILTFNEKVANELTQYDSDAVFLAKNENLNDNGNQSQINSRENRGRIYNFYIFF